MGVVLEDSLNSSSGKSFVEIVEKSALKFFALTESLPLFRLNSRFSFSGKDLQSSDIFLAETVVSPSSIISFILVVVLI